MVLLLLQVGAQAQSANDFVRSGNSFYTAGEFNKAIEEYDKALIEKTELYEPKFNKANSYFRLDDLAEAINLYRETAAGSKDMKLVEKAKYNLGNCYFARGTKQKDSDLKKAVE